MKLDDIHIPHGIDSPGLQNAGLLLPGLEAHLLSEAPYM